MKKKNELQELDGLLGEYSTKHAIKVEREQEEGRRIKNIKQKFLNNEEQLLEEKIELYQGILQWRDDLVASEQFEKISGFIYEKGYGRIILYGSSWGHEMDGDSRGCWSRLNLEKSGELEYVAGYKWMPTGPTINFTSGSEVPMKLTHDYLQKLHEHLESGKVYEIVKEKLKKEIEFMDYFNKERNKK